MCPSYSLGNLVCMGVWLTWLPYICPRPKESELSTQKNAWGLPEQKFLYVGYLDRCTLWSTLIAAPKKASQKEEMVSVEVSNEA